MLLTLFRIYRGGILLYKACVDTLRVRRGGLDLNELIESQIGLLIDLRELIDQVEDKKKMSSDISKVYVTLH